MRVALTVVALALIVAPLGICQNSEPTGETTLPPGVVAIVNGEPITKEAALDLVWQWQGQHVLRDIIEHEMIFQEAKRVGVTVSDEEVKAEIERMRGMLTHMTLEQALAQQQSTLERFTRETKLRLLVQKMVTDKIQVTPEDLDGVRARQIIIQVPTEEDTEKIREQAMRVRGRILAGESFADVAKEVSLDPAAGENGGDMGVVRKGMVGPEIEKALFSLKVGEVSEPIRGGIGYHLLLVEEKIPSSSLSEEERIRLTEERRSDLSQVEIPKWFEQLYQKTNIKCVFSELNATPTPASETDAPEVQPN